MTADFQVQIVCKYFLVPGDYFFRSFLVLYGVDVFALDTRHDADEAVTVFFYELAIDSRAIIKTLDMAFCHKLDEILVACLIFCEEYEAVRMIVGAVFLVMTRAWRHEKIDAEY